MAQHRSATRNDSSTDANQALIDAAAERERREFQESLLAQIERLQRREA